MMPVLRIYWSVVDGFCVLSAVLVHVFIGVNAYSFEPNRFGSTCVRAVVTHSPMLKARFLHLTNLVAQPGIEPPTS